MARARGGHGVHRGTIVDFFIMFALFTPHERLYGGHIAAVLVIATVLRSVSLAAYSLANRAAG